MLKNIIVLAAMVVAMPLYSESTARVEELDQLADGMAGTGSFCLIIANRGDKVELTPQTMQRMALYHAMSNVYAIHEFHKVRGLIPLEPYLSSLRMLVDYINENWEELEKSRPTPNRMDLVMLAGLLPEELTVSDELEEDAARLFSVMMALRDPENKEKYVAYTNYLSYIYPVIFEKEVKLAISPEELSVEQLQERWMELVMLHFEFVAMYQLLTDPDLEYLASDSEHKFFENFMVEHWDIIKPELKEQLYSSPTIKIWLNKWEAKLEQLKEKTP